MTCAAAACVMLIGAGVWSPSDSVLRIVPGTDCAAEVRIVNRPIDMTGIADGLLSLDAIEVRMMYDRDVGEEGAGPQRPGLAQVPDRFTALPPEGYLAIPESLTLWEGEEGVIRICAFQGV